MFIETLEFTIPVDLCDLFNSLKRGPKSNLEFPASVNSYGTTQDANIQVVLRSNKLTFKVDGVSSNASMISKSECKTLKLSIFDVDCTLMADQDTYEETSLHSVPYINPAKRSRDRSMPVRSPPSKISRTSVPDSSVKSEDIPQQLNQTETESVNVKQEPDLIEIEPDPDEYDQNAARVRSDHITSQTERLQTSTSSPSSFHQNIPHVQDYSEPGTSHEGEQGAEDYLVYQDPGDNDYDDNDNSADFGNDEAYVCVDCGKSYRLKTSYYQHVKRYHVDPAYFCRHCGKKFYSRYDLNRHEVIHTGIKAFACDFCGARFYTVSTMKIHVKRVHGTPFEYYCKFCGKGFNHRSLLWEHEKGHSDHGDTRVTNDSGGDMQTVNKTDPGV